jgi:hypothetical protein
MSNLTYTMKYDADPEVLMMYEARLKVARDRYAVESSMREQGRHEGSQ